MDHPPAETSLRWLTTPDDVSDHLRRQLLDCWRDVVDAGGAVGFPGAPVTDEEVRPAVDAVIASLGPDTGRLLVVSVDGDLAGWLVLVCNPDPLTAHWATVKRVQTSPRHRGRGIGRVLMTEVARAAREDVGLDSLHLDVRSGLGLEEFYRPFGWTEVGRWPAALQLAGTDRRDQVLMFLSLR